MSDHQKTDQRRETPVMIIKARRCQRCGGLLTGEHSIRMGYGAACLKKMKQEEREREEAKRFKQLTIFGEEKT